MSFQIGDDALLESAIKQGALRVRFSDGREVTYQDMDAMIRALALIQSEISKTSAPDIVRQYRPVIRSGW